MSEGDKDTADVTADEDEAKSEVAADEDEAKSEEAALAQQSEDDSTSEWLAKMMRQQLELVSDEPKPEKVLESPTFSSLLKYLRTGKCKNIITMAGAGISTSAGIPDFRSPGYGLYDNLAKYNLSSPQDIFDISFFKSCPEPFFQLAKELWPGVFKPTPCHYFIRLLQDKGLLLRHFTQNIDTLERVAGLPEKTLVEAHGTFHTSHCLDCSSEYTQDWIKEKIFADEIPHCTKEGCNGLVKPDIVFFGEALSHTFFKRTLEDIPKCDLLIIMGTSLVVQPFASLANRVPDTCPRLYINMEKAEGSSDPILAMLGMGHGFRFDEEDNYRDIFWGGTCDDGCQALANGLGWGDELKKLVADEWARIDAEAPSTGKSDAASESESPSTSSKKKSEL